MRRLVIAALLIAALSVVFRAQAPSYSLSGPTLPSGCVVGNVFWVSNGSTVTPYYCSSADTWSEWGAAGGGGGSVPAGSIVLVASGSCPTGFTESAALNGKTLVGTVAANADVGTTGGSDSPTPTGTVAWPAGVPTFAGAALGTHAHGIGSFATSAHSGTAVADHASHTHTYNTVIAHTHGFTDLRGAATGGATTNWNISTAAADTSSTVTTLLTASTGSASGTTAGPSATLTHSVTQPSAHTLSGSSEAVTGGTPAGTNTWPAGVPTFAGVALDNRSAFVRVIFCVKD